MKARLICVTKWTGAWLGVPLALALTAYALVEAIWWAVTP